MSAELPRERPADPDMRVDGATESEVRAAETESVFRTSDVPLGSPLLADGPISLGVPA